MVIEFYFTANPQGQQMVNIDVMNTENIPEGKPQNCQIKSCSH